MKNINLLLYRRLYDCIWESSILQPNLQINSELYARIKCHFDSPLYDKLLMPLFELLNSQIKNNI